MGKKVEEVEATELEPRIAAILDECRQSLAVHQRKIRELLAVRSKSGDKFASSFIRVLRPLFDVSKKTASSDRIIRFVSAFTARGDGKAGNLFLVQFLRFLLVAARAASKTARLRSCQIISQILSLLPEEADLSDQVWDNVIDCLKDLVEDKVPDIRACAVHALSHFSDDGSSADVADLLLKALSLESSAEVRRTIVQSLPSSSSTLSSIINCTLDVHESVRKVAYTALASNFPLQSLSIKIRNLLLRRGLADRSSAVRSECIKMLKEKWLAECCEGDLIGLLRCLDVETYESEGEAVMEALFEEGSLNDLVGQSIGKFLASKIKINEGVQLLEPEVAFYWRVVCKYLKINAETKGSEAAVKTGAEAVVYASEAKSWTDLLESVLPNSITDYIDLVNAHLSAGPNVRFSARQLLLLGSTLDFSDVSNRNTASSFVRALLLRPFDHDVDEEGQKVLIGDGISLGGDREWCGAVVALTKKVHASAGEFEEVVNRAVAELSLSCRERTADMIGWTHCLAVVSLLLENVDSDRFLPGMSELLHSLLLPAVRHVHIDVQKAGIRCLGLFGLLERKPSPELVKQLRLAFVKSQLSVKVMAARALIDLAAWHGPAELDVAVGLDPLALADMKSFTRVDFSTEMDDLNAFLLDLLYSGFQEEDFGQRSEGDERETVHGVLGEGFAKILLLGEKYPGIPSSLRPLIFGRLICLYFCSESKDVDSLKQCLSVFFDYYAALSDASKACISRAFIPVMRSLWPGLKGSSNAVDKKRAVNVSRFMLQLMQIPLRQSETTPGCPSTSAKSTLNVDEGEESLAIRIASEVASFRPTMTAALKSYAAALCKIVVDLRFRSSEQMAIKYMRKLMARMIEAMAKEREIAKELTKMDERLRFLDKTPNEELTAEIVADIREKLELDLDMKMDLPEKAVAPSRRRRRRLGEMTDDEEDADVEYSTPVTRVDVASAVRLARRSKTAAMSRLTASAAAKGGEDEWDEEDSDEDSEVSD